MEKEPKFSPENQELVGKKVQIESETEEAFNNRGERIFEQIRVDNHNVIYEGWGQSIFENEGVVYCLYNSGKLVALPKEKSSELLKTEWASCDSEDESMSDSGDKPGFPTELFKSKGIEIPKESIEWVKKNEK